MYVKYGTGRICSINCTTFWANQDNFGGLNLISGNLRRISYDTGQLRLGGAIELAMIGESLLRVFRGAPGHGHCNFLSRMAVGFGLHHPNRQAGAVLWELDFVSFLATLFPPFLEGNTVTFLPTNRPSTITLHKF